MTALLENVYRNRFSHTNQNVIQNLYSQKDTAEVDWTNQLVREKAD